MSGVRRHAEAGMSAAKDIFGELAAGASMTGPMSTVGQANYETIPSGFAVERPIARWMP
jgi:hypothetical protein